MDNLDDLKREMIFTILSASRGMVEDILKSDDRVEIEDIHKYFNRYFNQWK